MNKPTQPASEPRRQFLRRCAVVGGSAAVIGAAGTGAAHVVNDEAAPTAAEPSRQGYRLTPHIQDYYNKARF